MTHLDYGLDRGTTWEEPLLCPSSRRGATAQFSLTSLLILSVRFIHPTTLRPIPASHLPQLLKPSPSDGESAPPGTVKSILPCTPLAIVKVLEHLGVYNKMLEYGDRARGKVITVINR